MRYCQGALKELQKAGFSEVEGPPGSSVLPQRAARRGRSQRQRRGRPRRHLYARSQEYREPVRPCTCFASLPGEKLPSAPDKRPFLELHATQLPMSLHVCLASSDPVSPCKRERAGLLLCTSEPWNVQPA